MRGNVLPDRRSVRDQSVEERAATLSEIADAGLTEIDPTDCRIRVADPAMDKLLHPDDPQTYRKAIDGMWDLGRHAERVGVDVVPEMYLEGGLINSRSAIRQAVARGFCGAFCCEHDGGDGSSVSAAHRDYLRRILPNEPTPW